MAVRALITKEMLQWARQRTLGNLDEAAERLKVDRERLEAWENGEAQPTFRQAIDIAKKLKIPFGYLYLSEPPDESLPLPDLRVKPGTPPRDPSPDFLEVLYDAMRKQEWYHDYLRDEEADPVPFVGRYSMSSPVETVAEDIRRTLGLDEAFRGRTRDMGDYYVRLVEQAESAGVLVMRNRIVGNNPHRPLDPDEFQGFAMSDELAPLVFINQRDYLSAQIFTLMHELAHIWMGISGVSLQDYLERPIVQNELAQRLANEVAAETLVPGKDFISRWRGYDDIDQGLEALRRHYRVSIFVILRRTYDLGEIPFDVYRSKYDEFRSQIKPKKKGSGGGGYRTLFSRNSTTITTSLLHSVSEGKTLPTQASALLNVRPATVYNMQAYLAEN
jgi:Zn-dependent peptidase ImmA (M78 family)/DNA-binding XRE family transcriptional regulator